MIATALPEEFEAVSRLLASCERLDDRKGAFLLRGKIAHARVLLGLGGDGPARAEAALFTFEETLRRRFDSASAPARAEAALSAVDEIPGSLPLVSAFIGAGVCGALTPDLAPGDVLVSSRIADVAGDAPAPDPALIGRAVALGARPADFVSVARPLVSSNEKRRAAERLDAGGPPGRRDGSRPLVAAVDMESAGWARAAASRGVRYVVLRAVADTFEESLPSFLPDSLDASGSIDRALVARRAAARPWSVRPLLGMRKRVRAASQGLAAFLSRFLEGGLVHG